MRKHHIFKVKCVLISAIFMLQGCQAYKRTPVTLDEAVTDGSRAKVIYKNANRARFKQIVKDSINFYGIRGSEKVVLDEAEIDRVRIKDKTGSTVLTVITISSAVLLIGVMILAVDIAGDYGKD